MALALQDDLGIMNQPSAVAGQDTQAPSNKLGLHDDLGILDSRKPFYKAIGAEMTPEEKVAHPIAAGFSQTAQDVSTITEKTLNGLTLGGLDYGLRKGGIEPPNFDNTAPENKSGLKLLSSVGELEAGGETLGKIGSKVVSPIVKPVANAIGKAIPEGLKQASYSLMQSIVNQLPKEFKYGANAGRAMVREKLQGDASDIAQQSAAKIKEIGAQGDELASKVNTTQDYSKSIKVIDDKIAELQANAPRENSSTITRLQNAKKDLLGVVEDNKGNVIDEGKDLSNMTPSEALDFKRKYDYVTQWKGVASDDSVVNSTLQASRRAVKNQLNEHVPGMEEWNQRYADLSAANQAAMRRVTYDQAGAGMNNMLNRFIRGSLGISTLGAALTGNGQLAGEILAGWGAKEVMGNPMVKSKVAQMLYNMSEADLNLVAKTATWLKGSILNQNKATGAYAVKAELMPEGGWNQEIRVNGQKALPGSQPAGLPAPSGPSVPRSGVNPVTEPYSGQAALPPAGSIPIRQGGPSAPLQIENRMDSPSARNGINRPWENIGLPEPKTPGGPSIGSGPTIIQGGPPAPFDRGITSPPKYGTPQAWELYHKDKAAQEMNFIHPAKDAKLQSERFDAEYHTESPKATYQKQMEKYQKAQFNIEYYKDQLRSQIEQRKFLAKTIHPREFTRGEMQDIHQNWIKGTNKRSGWDEMADDFNRRFPGVLDPNGHQSDALREYSQTLTSENQRALRSLIEQEKKIRKPKKID